MLMEKHVKPGIKEIMESGTFLVSGEIGPPKGTDIDEMIEHIDLLKDKVHAMNITDNQSSVMRYPSLGTALIILEHGGEPNLQVTCRDRNRLAIEADLLFAYTRGVRSVLCLTGDSIPVGDHKEAKAVFDCESVQLLQLIRNLEEGKDSGGNEMRAAWSSTRAPSSPPRPIQSSPRCSSSRRRSRRGHSGSRPRPSTTWRTSNASWMRPARSMTR